MTYDLYHKLYARAADTGLLDHYIADAGASHEVLDLYGDDTAALIRDLTAIFRVANEGTRYIRSELGLTQEQFSRLLNIPKRTIESWDTGVRVTTDYLLTALAVSLGIYPFGLTWS